MKIVNTSIAIFERGGNRLFYPFPEISRVNETFFYWEIKAKSPIFDNRTSMPGDPGGIRTLNQLLKRQLLCH